MKIEFTEAKPANGRAIICFAGAAGSGKTASALRLATGITKQTGGDLFVIDTENRRSLRYSDTFRFHHFDFQPPFTAARYLEILLAADKIAKPGSVIVIDSMSHEHEGVGGMLQRADEFLNEKAGNDWKKREQLKMKSWQLPKEERRKFINQGLQRVSSHVIMCFRAKEKIKMLKGEGGKTEVVNVGWQVLGADEFAFESDVIFVLPPNSAGKPAWNEGAARINDMKGDLIKSLQAIPQVSEEMGKKILEFYTVKSGTPLAALEKQLGEAADKGTTELQKAFRALTPADQKTVQPSLENLKARAATADAKNQPAGVTGR